MSTLEPLMAIMRRPSASPWRCAGVTMWIMLITMGCTEPSTKPRHTEQAIMARALGIRG